MAAQKQGRNSQRKKPIWVRRVKQAVAFGTIVFLGSFVTLFIMFLLKLREAEELLQTPEFQDRMEAVSRPPTRIVTADGVELYRLSNEYRIPVKDLDEIPAHVRNAVLAAEDKRFYKHPGVDNVSLMRAFFSIFKEGRVSQGGSTITMQLAKRLFSGNERSLKRKIQDIAYAYAIEKYKTKDQILLLYLNQVYFGETAHGIAAASQVYFGKNYKKLSASDAALLARCVRLPSRYNPIKDLKSSIENRDVVLRIMNEEGMIDRKQYERALAETPKINPHPPKTTAKYVAGYGKHFVDSVLEQLRKDAPELDLKTGGYLIQTTIDSKLQKLAEASARKTVKDFRSFKVNQAAFVAMDSEGRILCEVGGVDYAKNQYNKITKGLRQPGSAFKAIVYAVGLQQGAISGPYDTLSNARYVEVDRWSGKVWDPKNASPRENASSYNVEVAFKLSVNRPAIHLMRELGPRTVIQYARDSFGIDSKLQPFLPLAIGADAVKPIELLEAYSVFALRGDRVEPYAISRIVSPAGEVIKQYQPQRYTGVMSSSVCETMDGLLRAVVTSGTGTKASAVPNARGKTGTTNDARDAWFCGYADGVVGIGWVGNEQFQTIKGRKVATPIPMRGSAYGGTITAQMWADIMKDARQRFGSSAPAVPSPATIAAAVPPVRQTDKPEDLVKPVDQPISQPVEEATPPEETVPFPEQVPPLSTPPTEDPGREAEEAEKRAERERQREQAREEARERRRRQEEERDRARSVTLDVCADSGMLANMYCPETVSRTFARDRAPNRACRLHGAG